jgi:hypothetical protein
LTRAFCRLSIKRVCVRGVAASISGDFTPNSRGVVLHRLSEEEAYLEAVALVGVEIEEAEEISNRRAVYRCIRVCGSRDWVRKVIAPAG